MNGALILCLVGKIIFPGEFHVKKLGRAIYALFYHLEAFFWNHSRGDIVLRELFLLILVWVLWSLADGHTGGAEKNRA